MTWKIEFDQKAANALAKLDKVAKKRILRFIDERLLTTANPRTLGYPLKGTLSGLWKYRIGEYRLISKIEDDLLAILIVRVGHRKNIYKI